MQTGRRRGAPGYGAGMRLALAALLWAAALTAHEPVRDLFYTHLGGLGPAGAWGLRATGVALVTVLTAVATRRLGARALAPLLLAAALVVGGATPGEVLHVAQYALYARLGGPPWLWVLGAVADEAWDMRGGQPFDWADVALDGVGVWVGAWVLAPPRGVGAGRGVGGAGAP